MNASSTSELRLPDGSKVTYAVEGEGLPILGMPGGPGMAAAYLDVFADLVSDRLTWYLIDPPGTGGSSPRSDYSIGAHAAFYAEVADALDLGDVLVFGHSYSGTVATTFAAERGARTLGCLLVAPPVVGTDVDQGEGGAIRAAMNRALARHEAEPWYESAVAAEFDPDMSDIDGSFRKSLPLYLADAGEEMIRRANAALPVFRVNPEPLTWFYEREWPSLDLRPIIPTIDCPLLAIVGEHDWAVPPVQAQLYTAAPHGEVEVVRDCGHFVPIEAPDAYRSRIGEWLEKTGLA